MQTNMFDKLGVLFSRKLDEHYTPDHILYSVYQVFGTAGVTLDPCSNSKDPEQANVKAHKYYTIDDDGLSQSWNGNIYLNPPFSDMYNWISRIVDLFEDMAIDSAIIVVPARTDTRWFNLLYDYPICFIKGRLRYKKSKYGGGQDAAPFPSVAVYLGDHEKRFIDEFKQHGTIVRKVLYG